MQKNTVIAAICFLLIMLFVYAGISKLANPGSFRFQLSNMDLINRMAGFLSLALPLAEILAALMLVVPQLRMYGLYTCFILLFVFTLYLAGMVTFKTSLPCSCGGIISKLSWKQHILFNGFFLLLAAAGIKLQRNSGRQTGQKFYRDEQGYPKTCKKE